MGLLLLARLAAVGSARGCVLQGELVPFGIRQSEGLEKRCQFGHSYEVTGAACIHGYTSDADPPHVVEELDNLFPPIQKIGFPTKDREIIGLLFYQGLSQAEASEVLDVSLRTVQRRWHDALCKLHRVLNGS